MRAFLHLSLSRTTASAEGMWLCLIWTSSSTIAAPRWRPTNRTRMYARSWLAQSQTLPPFLKGLGEPKRSEVQIARFGFLERHGDPVHWRIRFLVALHRPRDLLLCAKHLFVAAIVAIILSKAQG